MAINFKDLERADLVIDEIYCGGAVPNMSSEVLNKLMLCSNSGGFRQVKMGNMLIVFYIQLEKILTGKII